MLKMALAIFLTVGVAGVAHAAGDAAKGRAMASNCAGCHLIAGWRNAYPAYSVPKLGGQHADYIVAALKAYRAGDRSHPTMRAIAATLTDADMQNLAAYFAGVSAQLPAQ